VPRIAAAVTVLVLSGCGGGSDTATTRPTPAAVSLNLLIGTEHVDTPSCDTIPPDRGKGARVVVEDGAGKVVASGTTTRSTTPVQTTTAIGQGLFLKGCLYGFHAEVPSADSYRVTVSGHWVFDVTREQALKPDLRLFIDFKSGKLVAFPPVNGLLPPG